MFDIGGILFMLDVEKIIDMIYVMEVSYKCIENDYKTLLYGKELLESLKLLILEMNLELIMK